MSTPAPSLVGFLSSFPPLSFSSAAWSQWSQSTYFWSLGHKSTANLFPPPDFKLTFLGSTEKVHLIFLEEGVLDVLFQSMAKKYV